MNGTSGKNGNGNALVSSWEMLAKNGKKMEKTPELNGPGKNGERRGKASPKRGKNFYFRSVWSLRI